MNSHPARCLYPLPILSLLLLASFCATAIAQLPAARLVNIFPPGGRSGGTTEVSVAGTDLDGLRELWFSHRGITAANLQSNRFEVAIAKDVPPGDYEVRAVGKYGATNPRTFSVGALAEFREEQNSLDSPQVVKLESTINGRIDANAIDYFRFEAKAGQRILARCETRSIDSRLEPVLALYDGDGREISRSRSTALLDLAAPRDGEFTLRIHDITYRGGADFFYRLSIGTFPHIDHVMPLPAPNSGEKQLLRVFGHNLSAGSSAAATEQLEVDLGDHQPELSKWRFDMPAQHGLDLWEYRLRTPQGVSEGAPVRFATAPLIIDDDQNHAPSAARKLTPPCEVAGEFSKRGRDFFSFEAKKGDVYWIEVISHRLGFPTDPVLMVQRAETDALIDVLELNDSEPNVGGVEFNTSHRDPAGRFEAKQDGRYLVQLRDLFTHPSSAGGLAYQLVIRKPQPDFRLIALPATPLPAKKDAKEIAIGVTALRRDEVLPVRVIALRHEGFDAAIEITATNVPKGISAAPARIDAGKNSTQLFLHAAHGCPPTLATLIFRGTASIGGSDRVHDASAASLVWPVPDPQTEPVLSRGNADYVLSIMDDLLPVRLAAAEEKTWEAVTGNKLRIPLRLSVDGELAGTLKLKPVGAAALEAAKEFDFDPKSTNAVFEIDPGQYKLAPGTYSIALQGIAQVKPASATKGDKKSKETAVTVTSMPILLKVSTPLIVQTNSPAK